MKKLVMSGAIFLAGALIAWTCCWFRFVRPGNDTVTALYSQQVYMMAETALSLSQGDPSVTLQGITSTLPAWVQSLGNLPRSKDQVEALRKVKEFYKRSGKVVPPQIAGLLSSV
jgi:hypothetical protein